MKLGVMIIMVIVATCTEAFGQQAAQAPEVGVPVFHSLKLGLPLGSQLLACHIQLIGDAKFVGDIGKNNSCFYDTGPTLGSESEALVNIFRGFSVIDAHELPSDRRDCSVIVFMPAGSRLVADGTIESVGLEYKMAEVSNIMDDLKAKFGHQPFCEKAALRTGLGIPIDSLRCTWKTPWGLVSFRAPDTKIDTLSVDASTTKYIDFAIEQQRKDSAKRRSQF
jgi:hypothetical protein